MKLLQGEDNSAPTEPLDEEQELAERYSGGRRQPIRK
jgi:hypothetical protein